MLLAILLLLTLVSCSNGQFKGSSRYSTEFFGTYVEMICYDYVGKNEQTQLDLTWSSVEAILTDIDNSISLTNADSDVSRFNALEGNQTISISNTTALMIRIAKDLYSKTNGAYNPCVYPLVDLYGFSARFTNITTEQEYAQMAKLPYDRDTLSQYSQQLPQQEYIDAFILLNDFDGITMQGNAIDGYTLTKSATSVQVDGTIYYQQIDLGGIGKGYAVDMVRSVMADNGYQYGLFTCGGSSIYLGKYASIDVYNGFTEGDYNVGITSPRYSGTVGNNYMTTKAMDTVVSSSGDYQTGHYYMVGQSRLCHIIDADSGYPINYKGSNTQSGICAVAIFGGNGADGDCLSTALCVMGIEGALEYLNSDDNVNKYQYIITLYNSEQPNYCEVVTNIADYTISQSAQGYYRVVSTTVNGITTYNGQLITE